MHIRQTFPCFERLTRHSALESPTPLGLWLSMIRIILLFLLSKEQQTRSTSSPMPLSYLYLRSFADRVTTSAKSIEASGMHGKMWKLLLPTLCSEPLLLTQHTE